MTEKEKMINGNLYYAELDETLTKERIYCKDLCAEYNRLMPSDIENRNKIIRKLIGKTGEHFWIEQNFWCDYGYNITLGEDFYANHNLVILDGAKVTFGSHCFIAPNCGFYTAGHPLDAQQRNSGLEYAKPLTVGDNVWFGGNVIVLPGVTIGDNVVIGAGSVVNKDIPSNVIAVGNPCHPIREITEKDIAKLQ